MTIVAHEHQSRRAAAEPQPGQAASGWGFFRCADCEQVYHRLEVTECPRDPAHGVAPCGHRHGHGPHELRPGGHPQVEPTRQERAACRVRVADLLRRVIVEAHSPDLIRWTGELFAFDRAAANLGCYYDHLVGPAAAKEAREPRLVRFATPQEVAP